MCGADNQNYDNDCRARAATGQPSACAGECPCPSNRPLPRPAARPCPLLYAPVCSTANEGFPNQCVAEARGATVACNGRCPCP